MDGARPTEAGRREARVTVPAAPPGYRTGVGVMLVDDRGRAFTGERLDMPGAWQMPQGGIEAGETAEEAARRELGEETGIRSASRIAVAGNWKTYDLPKDLAARLWGGRYRGQAQIWTLFRFEGPEAEIDLAVERPEFGRWKWSPLDVLVAEIVPFKRDVYREVVREFAPLVG